MLTEKQLHCLTFIDAEIRRSGGVSPSYDEIRTHLGLKSKSGAFRLVTALEERGFLRRGFGKRNLEVLRMPQNTGAATSGDFSELPTTAEGLRAELRALETLVHQRIEALDLIEAAAQAIEDAANDPEAEPDPLEPWQVPARSDFLYPVI